MKRTLKNYKGIRVENENVGQGVFLELCFEGETEVDDFYTALDLLLSHGMNLTVSPIREGDE